MDAVSYIRNVVSLFCTTLRPSVRYVCSILCPGYAELDDYDTCNCHTYHDTCHIQLSCVSWHVHMAHTAVMCTVTHTDMLGAMHGHVSRSRISIACHTMLRVSQDMCNVWGTVHVWNCQVNWCSLITAGRHKWDCHILIYWLAGKQSYNCRCAIGRNNCIHVYSHISLYNQ